MIAPTKERASLRAVALKGGAILGVAGALESLIIFVRALVLANILTPTDFGVMGMALLVVQAGEALSQTGFYQALVQKRGDATPYLDSVFCVTVARGITLFAATWIVSPLAGVFFATGSAVPVIRVVAFSFLIQCLQNPALSLLERELSFGRFALPSLIGILVDTVSSVIIALAIRSVWAIAWGYLIGRTAMLIASYAVRPYMPALRWRWEQISEFRGFGKHIFRGAATNYVGSQADKAIVGRLLGAEPLGLYSFAWRVASIPATSFFTPVFRVAFPVFSSVQEDSARLRKGFLRALSYMMVIAAPISAGILAVSSDLVQVAFDAKWSGMLAPLRVFCLAGPWIAVYSLLGMIVGGIGRPDIVAQATYVFLGAILLAIYPATVLLGVVGASLSVCLAGMAAATFLLARGMRLVACSGGNVLRGLAPPILASVGMATTVYFSRRLLAGPSSIWLLGVEIAIGVGIYAGLLALTDSWFSSQLLPTMAETVRGLRARP
ncbi:MAG: lipopolysaccharide biosynthesis protein [Acidobacteria bacterium]|nr:lipopolysaccharide biosynthesis protein [Acidobacteriota bacterium]